MLTKTTGVPLDEEQNQQRYANTDHPNKPRILDSMKMEGKPEFKPLGDLKELFKSNIIVEVPLPNGEIVHFRVKRVDPGTLFLTNRTLLFLLKNNVSENDMESMSTMDLIKSMDDDGIENFEAAMAADLKTKCDMIIANVLEPQVDRELVEAFPPDVIDTLFNAIARGLEDSQELLAQFPENEPNQAGETLIHRLYLIAKTAGQRPSKILFPKMVCPTTRLAVDFFVFDVGYFREEEKRMRELELQIGAGQQKRATRGLVGI